MNLSTPSKEEFAKLLFTCCGSQKWVDAMMQAYPFADAQGLLARANEAWYHICGEADWRESFLHHPKIGDVASLKTKFAATQHLAGNEQAGTYTASDELIEALAQANTDYYDKFGHIFIVCATGKSAQEMYRLLKDRLANSAEEELRIAMGEQHKISLIRFKKIFTEADWSFLKVSQITTHVLDTSLGKTGKNICIRLKQEVAPNQFVTIAQGLTNADGRIPDLLPQNKPAPAGVYMMSFDTKAYFEEQQIKGFYPAVDIQFTVFDTTHYHIPLLINPYGYSTYRGS